MLNSLSRFLFNIGSQSMEKCFPHLGSINLTRKFLTEMYRGDSLMVLDLVKLTILIIMVTVSDGSSHFYGPISQAELTEYVNKQSQPSL